MLANATPSKLGNVLTVLQPLPFTIGRKPGNSLQLNSRAVSSFHAEFVENEFGLLLIDHQSTNGTYVNGKRIHGSIQLNNNDLVQFADSVYRLRSDNQLTSLNTISEDVCDQALALVQFDRMMENRLVTPHFQPIVDMQQEGQTVGYEILARSRMFGLESSAAMFSAAARMNMEVELSQMLRWEGIREALSLPQGLRMFVNTHPLELNSDSLLPSMKQVRELATELPITLEIHEGAVTNPAAMRELRKKLRDLEIEVAYDDFGAGQNRLAELFESPPDVLKFDMGLIRGIDTAAQERQKLLSSLTQIVLDLGVKPLAEGIETAGEAAVCKQVGISLAQGYFFGRPASPNFYTG
jgi:EAL domain-containing protein (putative c-di-GMP-specific phosphodiesterase class I)